MSRSTAEDKINNAGFSLVELIIVVSILAIAAVPLIKSMSMSTKVNAKAQSIQNATSLGERVMEEVKSSDIASIVKSNGGFNGSGECTYTYPITTATQGENFDVKVTISKNTYSGATEFSTTDKKANVKSANTLLIPSIEDIDTLSQAVLSPKELNKYDTEAQNFFNQKNKKYSSSDAATHATITKKTIDIEKADAPGSYHGVTVKAIVTYEGKPAGDSRTYQYIRDLYSGTFIEVEYEKEDGSTAFKPLDSNIYLFYKKGCITETINIKDYSTYTNSEHPDDHDSHRIYMVRQDTSDTTGPSLVMERRKPKTEGGGVITSHTFKFSDSADSLDAWYESSHTDMELISNVYGSSVKHIYKEEARTRVYDITVALYKDGTLITTLNSTASASDDI